jgi:cytochrome c oxidase assembly protein subunit 15
LSAHWHGEMLEKPRAQVWLHRYALFSAAVTCVLIFVGGLVTSTGSGLAVPDWPLSFGQVFPPMVGGVLYEHGHRLMATFVGMSTVVLAVWVWLHDRRPMARRLVTAALVAVVVQGLLGGMTVLLRLPTSVSVAHACLGQAFFCLMVAIALVTNPRWELTAMQGASRGPAVLPSLATATTALIFLQLLLGATTRHMGAGLAIPDFPLSFGRLVPPVLPPPVLVHFAHRIGALTVTVLVTATLITVLRARPRRPELRRPAWLLLALVLVQVTLGAVTIWSWRAVLPTTAHVAVGAMILATSLVLSMRSHHLLGRRERVGVRPAVAQQVPA